MRILLFVVFILTSSQPLFAQRQLIVRDAVNHQAISGAQIVLFTSSSISGLQLRTTGTSGRAWLPDSVVSDSVTILASGYLDQKVVFNSQAEILVLLQPQAYSIDLAQVELSAYASGKNLLEQSGGISFISAAELARENDVILTPALNRVPGVYMHSGALNTNRISIRGIGARSLFSTSKIRAYLNDIPISTGDGETTIEDIDLSLIDRIEVIKGPASSMYGAALGGTINLQTGLGTLDEVRINNQLTLGSFGLLRNTLQADVSGQKQRIRLGYNQTQSDGYRDNNEYDRQGFSIIGQWLPSADEEISLILNYTDLLAFIPSSIDSATFADSPTDAAFTWGRSQGFEDSEKALFGLSYQKHFSSIFRQSTSIFGGFRNAFEVRPFNILKEQTQQLGIRSRLIMDGNDKGVPLMGQIGVETFSEWYNWQTNVNVEGLGGLGDLLSQNEEVRRYWNVFGQVDWRLSEKTALTAGLNLNQTNYRLEDLFPADSLDQSGAYQFNLALSPRLAINHALLNSLSNQIHLHASIAHGFSPPSLEETLTPDGQINPDIQPENGWNLEMGIRGNYGKLFFDLSLYRMYINDLLVARRTGNDAFVGVNAGASRHDGLELAMDYQLLAKGANQVKAFLRYTYANYRFTDFVDGDDDFSGNAIPGTPPHHLHLGLDAQSAWGLYGNVNFQFVGSRPLRDDNILASEPYQVLNARIGFRREIGQHLQLDIFGGLQNVLDEQYASMILINAGSFGGRAPRYFYPGLPRNWFAGAKLAVFFRPKQNQR